MNLTFVTSDTHFGHENIIRYCERPFKNSWEMSEWLVTQWNTRVGHTDTIYFLGDFAMGPKVDEGYILGVLLRLNGNKLFLLGNHDKPSKYGKGLRAIIQDNHIENIKVLEHDIFDVKIDGREFVMCHYPMSDWEGRHSGAVHLHGHVHTQYRSRISQPIGQYDIGVDMYGGPVQVTGDLRFLNDPRGWE